MSLLVAGRKPMSCARRVKRGTVAEFGDFCDQLLIGVFEFVAANDQVFYCAIGDGEGRHLGQIYAAQNHQNGDAQYRQRRRLIARLEPSPG